MIAKLERNWKVHIIHHTHLDIGYTHRQDDVLTRQFQHLEVAMDLIDKNKTKPEESRFRWNPEITWALEPWYNQTSEDNKKRFIAMVKEGYIGIDGLYANILTSLCRPEELMANFTNKKTFESLTNTTINSAMFTDIPGWNWGFVTALAENGIKYLSTGPNRSDRIGYAIKDWGDQPFYWLSPSGKEKVLVYTHGKGYSWFHHGMHKTENLKNKLTPSRISKYLKKLEKENYPYDTIIIRYNIGADNGPPDINLSDITEKWNQKYPQMHMRLSTTAQAMATFEKEYRKKIPEYSGDYTPYWEDGAASTARETAVARNAGERLTQAIKLNAMLNKKPLNKGVIDAAWKDVILYNEHTWGAYNSISKPDHPFALSQWEWKKNRAYDALNASTQLINETTKSSLLSPASYDDILNETVNPPDGDVVTVYNTQSWNVSQMVRINTPLTAIKDDNDEFIECQKLSNGQLAFYASDIPSMGSRTYNLSSNSTTTEHIKCQISGYSMWNDYVKISLNEKTGTIDSIIYKGKELVKQSETEKFNQYKFVANKYIKSYKKDQSKTPVEIIVLENGPLLTSFRVIKDGYKTRKIVTDITIEAHSEKIYLSNLVDRVASRKKEGIHFEFPLNFPRGRVKYDTSWGSAVIDKDQLKGSNKNFITANRWFDVSDKSMGMSCTLLDAPIFKSGPLISDPLRSGPPKLCGWLRETQYNGTIYSYIMNNYWMTNYKADQPGETLFRYVFMPHGQYSEAETCRFALEVSQPLIVGSKSKKAESLLTLTNDQVIVSSFKQTAKGDEIRLFNISEDDIEVNLELKNAGFLSVLSPNKSNVLNDNKIILSKKETILLLNQRKGTQIE